jgi:hypothetical protein
MESFGDALLVAQATAQSTKGSTAQWYHDRWERPLPEIKRSGRICIATPLYRLAACLAPRPVTNDEGADPGAYAAVPRPRWVSLPR